MKRHGKTSTTARISGFCLSLFLPVFLAFLSACKGPNGPGFSETDRFVADTGEFADQRVFYVSSSPIDSGTPQAFGLTQSPSRAEAKKLRINHGSPLSISINTVSLPKQSNAQSRDIAVHVKITTTAQDEGAGIIVWYQRGVKPDQPLSFTNLLIYTSEFWSSEFPPIFRIRVIDVAKEKNEAARETLDRLTKYERIIGGTIPNPLLNPIIYLARKAADLVVPNKSNVVLLDYTIQFYAQESMPENGASGSFDTPLLEGRFVLLARPQGKRRDYWKNKFYYESKLKDVYNQSSKTPVASPFVLVNVSSAEAILPTIVLKRSEKLKKLLTSSKQPDLGAIEREGLTLITSLKAYLARKRVKRYRNTSYLKNAYNLIVTKNLHPQDKYILIRMFEKLSGCKFSSTEKLKWWWNNYGSTSEFKENEFRLRLYKYCS